MQTANQRRALGQYSHARMVSAPDWLPIRRAPRSTSGRAKTNGLAYERATISAIQLAFNETQPLRCNRLPGSNSNIVQSNINKNKQTDIGRPELIAGQWIEYKKNNIIHFCQPDLLIIFPPLDPIPSGNFLRGNHLTIPTGSISRPANHTPDSGNFLNKNLAGQPAPALIICCEIKLTYTPTAIKKLNQLYLPLVDSIFHPHILLPLIICKNLTGASPPHSFSLLSSLSNPLPLIIYPGSGNFRVN